ISQEPPGYLPMTMGTGSYSELEKKALYLQEKGRYVLGVAYGSHFEKANFCRGIENFLADLAGEPDYAERLLNEIIRKNMVMLENAVHFPLDGILLGSDWGSQQSMLMSPDVWRKMIKPGEVREYEVIKNAKKHVWIHSCGNIAQIIPDLVEMGVDVLNPMQPEVMDIFGIKDSHGERLSFWGGITTQRILPYGTPAEVAKEAREVIQRMSRKGGYITAPSQDYQADVPYENTLALLEEARGFTRAF
ncbi:MAG: uroporphyrinogen decarboxylase family protein, partial [Clostridia bacterium]